MNRATSFALIEDTRHRVLHKQVLRLPFSDDKARPPAARGHPARLSLEREIAAEAGRILGRAVPPESIIVDVPERLSFDATIPVVDPSQAEPEEAEIGPGPRCTASGTGISPLPSEHLGQRAKGPRPPCGPCPDGPCAAVRHERGARRRTAASWSGSPATSAAASTGST